MKGLITVAALLIRNEVLSFDGGLSTAVRTQLPKKIDEVIPEKITQLMPEMEPEILRSRNKKRT